MEENTEGLLSLAVLHTWSSPNVTAVKKSVFRRLTTSNANKYGRVIVSEVEKLGLNNALQKFKGIEMFFDPLYADLVFSYEWRKEFYNRSYELATDEQLTFNYPSWGDMFDWFTNEGTDLTLSSIFIRLVEDQENVKIKTLTQLKDLTGITSYGPEGDEESKAKLQSDLTMVLYEAKLYTYISQVEKSLRAGAKYPEISQLSVKDFDLSDHFTALHHDYEPGDPLAHAIALALDLPRGDENNINLRSLAKSLNAPYEVMLQADKMKTMLINQLNGTQ